MSCTACEKKVPERDKRMLIALQEALGDDEGCIKRVWRQMFVMGLVDGKDRPYDFSF